MMSCCSHHFAKYSTLVFILISCALAQRNPNEVNADYWRTLGKETLRNALTMQKIETSAKNVIFFLGDGMGIPTVTAMRIHKGQKAGKSGEEEKLSFDRFPYVSLSKTYALDRQNPDSANTATAYLCGVKANYGTLGVDGRVNRDNCTSSTDSSTHLTSILQWAQEAGKWTGFVTSTRVTHATPAGLYARSASRDWEGASPDSRCDDIATQLVHGTPGKDIHVILGGGRRMFLPSTVKDIEGKPGSRNDTRNLLDEWLDAKTNAGKKAKRIFDYESFTKVDISKWDYLLGLFHSDHLPYVTDRKEEPVRTPTLVELTEMAIKMLKKNHAGYFLLVEGGRIDHGHHKSWAHKALEEGVEFDQAIQKALDMTDVKDTLIVVTADHSHTFTIGGDYPARGNKILGLGGLSDVDNMTITTLAYANGLGYKTRSNVTEQQVLNKEYAYDAAFPMEEETHGAEDVAVYATGPMAHLFHGVHEQSYIPYVMGHALCVGPINENCISSSNIVCASTTVLISVFYLIVLNLSF